LSEQGYTNVVVFCTAGDCRNNLGKWSVRSVKPPHSARDFAFFTAKDAAMVAEAEFGLMLWDGQSSGTIVNVARMVAAGKPVVLYISPNKVFATLKSREDLENLLQRARTDVASKVRRYIAEHAADFEQSSIFGAA
jgi:adenine-specific DNA-methyltransferase